MQDVIKGLTNGVHYDVVVSAVDGSGNVGPPSICVTDFPAPVNDFFKIYRQDGGQAGGSFCALEAVGQPAGAPIVGVGFGAVAFAMARRPQAKPELTGPSCRTDVTVRSSRSRPSGRFFSRRVVPARNPSTPPRRRNFPFDSSTGNRQRRGPRT